MAEKLGAAESLLAHEEEIVRSWQDERADEEGGNGSSGAAQEEDEGEPRQW